MNIYVCITKHFNDIFLCWCNVLYSGVCDACDVTLSVYPHRASLRNMPGHGGNRTYDQQPEIFLTRSF
jgi:hypothetical protein